MIKPVSTCLFILALVLVSCGIVSKDIKKEHQENQEVDITTNLFNKYKDIEKQGVDTVMIYLNDCSGCIKGSKKWGCLFWKENGLEFGSYYDS